MSTQAADTRGWTALIDDIVAGDYYDEEAGATVTVPYESIVFRETLDGAEAELITGLGLGERLAVVADENTYDVLGQRIATALKTVASDKPVVLKTPHADMQAAADLAERLKPYDGVIAVGSGTINDLCKYVTAQDGRRYAVFALSLIHI